MTPKDAVAGYDALWRELRAAQSVERVAARGWQAPVCRPHTQIVLDMIGHCEAAAELYRGSDDYRYWMWYRRATLHASGAHGRVWDGTDPIRWRQAIASGRRIPA